MYSLVDVIVIGFGVFVIGVGLGRLYSRGSKIEKSDAALLNHILTYAHFDFKHMQRTKQPITADHIMRRKFSSWKDAIDFTKDMIKIFGEW